jgi:DUF2075 family protein
MDCAWHGSLAQAATAAAGGAWIGQIERGFRAAFGDPPSDDEVQAWRLTLPTVLRHFASRQVLHPDCHAIVEYRLPFNGQRVDLALVGQGASGAAVHVVELKHWQQSEVHPDLRYHVRVGGQPAPHPAYQAANYAGKLRWFHSMAQAWDVSGSALVLDREAAHHAALRDGRYADLWTAAPVFLPGELDAFTSYAARRVSRAPVPGQAECFLAGTYTQSVRLFDALRQHQREILTRALGSLAVAGWGLSDEQLRVFAELGAAIQRGQPGVHLVVGGPGSGKSLLALHLFLDAIGNRRSTVLALRNNRLIACLRAILDRSVIGARGTIKFFSTRYGQGVEDRPERVADLLVCDEAQRLALRSDNVLRRAPVTVVLYDESQILNLEEQGTGGRLRDLARGVGHPVCEYSLPTPHRCRGGAAYLRWLNSLLNDPRALAGVTRPWEREYTLTAVASAEALLADLRTRRETGRRVALIAAFTRSSGRSGTPEREGLGRVRIPEVEPQVEWLMDEEREYVPFWVEGLSRRLTQCASIYGCQGFETDHAGLVWGDDLVVRGGRWAVGNPANCYDRTQQATPLRRRMVEDPQAALRLLKNRYRILLTRGIFGTTIYAEDRETRAFLGRLLPPPRTEHERGSEGTTTSGAR